MIAACELPEQSLLRQYLDAGAYTDCYVTEVPGAVAHPEYVEAFYTTGVFKLERLILSLLVKRSSSDAQARELALGQTTSFAAWSVEARARDQLLLRDVLGNTRSWLMCSAGQRGGTRLFFGSAVVPARDRHTGKRRMKLMFRALLGFHKLYSRILLAAAARRLGG